MKTAVLFVFIAGASIGFIGALTVLKPNVDHWRSAYKSTSARELYYSDALIDRGLITLCDRSGETGVWLIEECDE